MFAPTDTYGTSPLTVTPCAPPVIVVLATSKPASSAPEMPSPLLGEIVIRCRAVDPLPLTDTAALVVCWITPPDPAVLPSPPTSRPPLGPVPEISTPSAGPARLVPAEIDVKLRPLDPICVPPATFSAVPVVVASVLVASVTVTTPPPVASNASCVPVLAWIAEKLIVAPVSAVMLSPPPWSLTVPLTATVPPVRPVIATEWPVRPLETVIGAPITTDPLPPVTSTASAPPALIVTLGPIVNEPTLVAVTPAPEAPATWSPATASPSASVTPAPPLLVTVGVSGAPPAPSSVSPSTTRAAPSPTSDWLASSWTPPS